MLMSADDPCNSQSIRTAFTSTGRNDVRLKASVVIVVVDAVNESFALVAISLNPRISSQIIAQISTYRDDGTGHDDYTPKPFFAV